MALRLILNESVTKPVSGSQASSTIFILAGISCRGKPSV